MIQCPSCGRQNPSGVANCHHCGTLLADAAPRVAKDRTQVEHGLGEVAGGKRKTQVDGPDLAAAPGVWGGGSGAVAYTPPPPGPQVGGGEPVSNKRRTVMGDVFVAGAEPGGGVWSGGGPSAVQPAYGAAPFGEPEETRRLMGWLVSFDQRRTGDAFEIREGRTLIGRGDEADIRVPEDGRISERHAMILCRSGRFQLFDERSSTGTFLNDEEIFPSETRDLSDGDVVTCGRTRFLVKLLSIDTIRTLWP